MKFFKSSFNLGCQLFELALTNVFELGNKGFYFFLLRKCFFVKLLKKDDQDLRLFFFKIQKLLSLHGLKSNL